MASFVCRKCGKGLRSLTEIFKSGDNVFCDTCFHAPNFKPDFGNREDFEKAVELIKKPAAVETKIILLVDDDVHIRKLYTEEFSEVFGDRVKTIAFRDGLSAFDFFKENLNNVHLIISNIIMPGIDGIKFLKLCKKLAPNIPFIISTSYEKNEAMQKATSEADAYIVKGADFLSELLDAVRKLLDIDDDSRVLKEVNLRENEKPIEPHYKDSNMQQAKEMIHAEVQKKEITLYKKGDFIGQKYEVFGVLGEGGFGIVYLVYSHKIKGTYALKTFRDEYLEDAQTRERFKKEAQIWIDLERHPYLVSAHFVDEISGRLFIAVEHIAPDDEGLNTLEGYLRSRPPDLAQSLRWAIQFCHGMEYAYSKGIKAHRDIKPANILIGQDKAVKISDFGLAGVISTSKPLSGIKINPQRNISGAIYQTMEGSAFGTPPYMSPEQFENAAGCDERSDIYSFGIVLYQMASGGKLPFLPEMAGDMDDNLFQNWYMLHSKATVPRLKSPLFPIIFRCLEKNPSNRYFSFKELRRDLESLLKKQTGEVVKVPELKELEAWELGNKGTSLANLGKEKEAIACYDRVLEINPRDAKAWYSKGASLSNLGKYQDAIACYDNALEINPRYAKAWNNKGIALGMLGKHQEAIACFKRDLEINPRDAKAWSNKGIALEMLGKHQEAIACYDKALEINPGYADAWYIKGFVLESLGKHQEAIACYDKAIELNPGFAKAWYSKGNALEMLGKHQEAIACYDKALEINPGYADAWYIKGFVLEMLGKHQEAIKAFNCFIKFAPPQDAKRVSEAKEIIQKIDASLAKDKVDDLRQNHSEPLANSGFKREDTEPRPHHYLFSHMILPTILFENPKQLAEKLLTQGKTLLITLWDTCANKFPVIKEKLPSLGLDCKIIKAKDNISIILISLPKPLKLTEAYYTAIVYRPNKLFLNRQKGIARYITLERTVGNGDNTAVLCEYVTDGDTIKHTNHGKHLRPTAEDFLRAINDLIS